MKPVIPEKLWAIYDRDVLSSQGNKMAIFDNEKEAKRVLKFAQEVKPNHAWRIVLVLISEIKRKK